MPLVAVELVEDVPQGPQVGLQDRFVGAARHVLHRRHGDRRQDADDGDDDDQLEQGETPLGRPRIVLSPVHLVLL